LIGQLQSEGILLPWELGDILGDLHRRVCVGTDTDVISPTAETARIIRDSSGKRPLSLPTPDTISLALGDALAARRSVRRFSKRELTLPELATILGFAAGSGPTAGIKAPLPLVLGAPTAGRTYPSGGALYPIETLIYPLSVRALEPAFYRYQALSHQLIRTAPTVPFNRLVGLLNDHPLQTASMCVLLWAYFASESLSKYGEAAYKLMLLEAGHIGQNLLLVASGLRLAGLPLTGFHCDQLSRAAGLDPPNEAIIYVVLLGEPDASNEVGDESRFDGVEGERDYFR